MLSSLLGVFGWVAKVLTVSVKTSAEIDEAQVTTMRTLLKTHARSYINESAV